MVWPLAADHPESSMSDAVPTVFVERPDEVGLRLRAPPSITAPLLRLGAHVHVPSGSYPLGGPGDAWVVRLPDFAIGAWPVTNALMRRFARAGGLADGVASAAKLADPALEEHPATDVTFRSAEAFCRWASDRLGARIRLPTGDEWEAAARGPEGLTWPWGDVFDSERCASAETAPGWTTPVTAHPGGASPFGTFDMAGNVWEWVTDPTEGGAWRACRGGSYLDFAWGVRASRSQPADPDRATGTTGFRLLIEGAHPCIARDGALDMGEEVW
jgi:formylglycine-generating enzyme required for sulfatase activity